MELQEKLWLTDWGDIHVWHWFWGLGQLNHSVPLPGRGTAQGVYTKGVSLEARVGDSGWSLSIPRGDEKHMEPMCGFKHSCMVSIHKGELSQDYDN